MKTNWQIKKLGEIGTIFNGNSINEKVKKTKYTNLMGGIPFIATKDIDLDSHRINYDNGIKIPEYEKNFKITRANSVLICAEGGSAGKKIAFNKMDIYFGNKLFALETNKNYDPKYVFYYYLSDNFNKIFRKQLNGLIGGVSINNFKNIEIPFPSLVEQKRIVSILDKVFEKLYLVEKNAEENLIKSKNIFESYLQSIFANPGKNWNESTIDSFSKVGTGATPLKSNGKYYGGNISWVTSKSTSTSFVNEADDYITDLAIKETNCKINQIHTLIIAMYGQGKTRGQVSELLIEAATNQAIATVLVNEAKMDRTFVKYFFIYNYESMRQMAEGGLQLNLNLSKIKKMKISFPKSILEQKSIVKKLDQLSEQTKKLESIYQKKLGDLKELKKSILNKAFIGEL